MKKNIILYKHNTNNTNNIKNIKNIKNTLVSYLKNRYSNKINNQYINNSKNRYINNIINKYMDSFDIEFYRNYYEDLKNFDDNYLNDHYQNYGKNEGRLTSQKQLDDLIASTGENDFDIKFYKTYHKDLSHMRDLGLFYHYNNWGKQEGRFVCQKQLDECKYPPCLDFYRNYHSDLSHMNDSELNSHYYSYGKKEGRMCCQKQLDELFDISFYRLINPQLNNLNDYEVEIYYYKKLKSKKNEYVKYTEINYGELNNQIRTITNSQEIIGNFDDYSENIYNKKMFLQYYQDKEFDFEFYKNKYLKNTEFYDSTDFDILLHYHNIGRKHKYSYNTKITIIIYSLILNNNCGGIVVMHNMAKVINSMNNKSINAKIANPFNIKYNNPFCEEFANINEINDNCVVVYPEIISGNPLNANNVVRWILLDLGIEMSKEHYKNWNKKDLVYHWEPCANPDNSFKQLCYPWFNPFFKNINNNTRSKTCYLVKKGPLIHKEIHYFHPERSIEINDFDNNGKYSYYEHVFNIFNSCKYFFCYDPNSAFIIFAAICGCIPVVYPIENVDKKTYLQNRIFNCGSELHDFIAYGNTESELLHAEEKIKNIDENINSMTNYYLQTVYNFIEDMKDFYSNKNIVSFHYCFFDYYDNYDANKLYFYDNTEEKIDLFEEYKTYFSENNIEYYDNYYILENHENYFRWIKYCLEIGYVAIISPITNIKITTDKYFIINIEKYINVNSTNYDSICNYYFEKENLVLGIGLGTINPMETRVLFLVDLNNNKIYYNCFYNKDFFKINILSNIITNVSKIRTIDFTKFEKKNITHFSFQQILGHQLFNEMTGLFILNYFGLEKYIDTVLIGKKNFFYIDKFFDSNKIEFVYNNILIDDQYGRGIVFKYNHYFISDKCVNFIHTYIQNNFHYDENFINEIQYIKSFYPIINITLRTKTNVMYNQATVISEVINKLTEKYPNSFFFLDGFCNGNENNENNENCENSDVDEYNKVVNDIVQNIKTENYKNLINLKLHELLEYYKTASFSMYQLGSICCLSAWLCNVDGIEFGRKNIIIYESIDKNIKQNGPNINYIYDEDKIVFHSDYHEISSDIIVNVLEEQLHSKVINEIETRLTNL